jgi:hypothetical protein
LYPSEQGNEDGEPKHAHEDHPADARAFDRTSAFFGTWEPNDDAVHQHSWHGHLTPAVKQLDLGLGGTVGAYFAAPYMHYRARPVWLFARMARSTALPALALVVAVGGALVAGCGGAGFRGSGRPIVVVVVNDGHRTVELQPSCGGVCHPFEPAILAPGNRHYWPTVDGEPGSVEFDVNVPHNYSLGCLLPQDAYRVTDHLVFRVSRLAECVT